MKLKVFLENINKLVKADPSILQLDVVSSRDDEGNGFNPIYYTPSTGEYLAEDKEFTADVSKERTNSVCIN